MIEYYAEWDTKKDFEISEVPVEKVTHRSSSSHRRAFKLYGTSIIRGAADVDRGLC